MEIGRQSTERFYEVLRGAALRAKRYSEARHTLSWLTIHLFLRDTASDFKDVVIALETLTEKTETNKKTVSVEIVPVVGRWYLATECNFGDTLWEECIAPDTIGEYDIASLDIFAEVPSPKDYFEKKGATRA